MTIYRCPVLPLKGGPAIEVKEPLACIDFDGAGSRIGSTCDKKFKSLATGVSYQCPNVNKGCAKGAFLYPRKKRSTGGFHYHQGIDIGNKTGQPIVAVVGGEVVGVHKEDDNNGYGRSVVIKGRHRGKDLYTLYGHCDKIFVNLGERVAEQQIIASVGHSGNAGSAAPHLHFECSNTKLPTKVGVETVLGQTEGPFPRIDPHRVLAELGPWGSTQVYFPNGAEIVNEQRTNARHALVENSGRGGYFPLGSNNSWHGGVHLPRDFNQRIVAPFDAEIVALRLDPNPATALRAHGHTNFILLRHEISDEAFRRLQWRPNTPGTPDDEADAAEAKAGEALKDFAVGYPLAGPITPSHPDHVTWVRRRLTRIREYSLALASDAPQVPAVSISGPYDDELRAAIRGFQLAYVPYFGEHPDQAEGYVTAKGDTRKRLAKPCAALFKTKKKPPKGTPPVAPETATVGRECSNEASLVIKAKHALHDANEGPFYAPSDAAALDDPTVDEAFIAAIEAFQDTIGYPYKTKGKLWPDGVMTVGAKTWTALFAAQPAPPPGTDPAADEPARLDPKRTIYSLFMHLNALPLDAATAKRFPWLGEVALDPTPEEEQDVAVQRAAKTSGDDAERSRGIGADVGAPGVASEPGDVEWVQQRLTRFGYYTGEIDGVYDDELRAAIAEFQRKHVAYYSPTASKPQDAPGYAKVGVVSKSGKITKADTHKRLKESYGSLFDETKPPVDAVFALRAAKRGPDELATIITRPQVLIGAGQPLWASGLAQGRVGASGVALYPQFHWELFAEHPLVEPWEQLEDLDDDLTLDVPGKVFDRIEYDGPPGFAKDNVLHPEEVLEFYASGKAVFLRQMQCRFRSEWGLDIATSVARLEEQGFATDGYAEQIRPYVWWDEAKQGAGDAMPASKHVWHYNPIEFLWRYEQVLATMRPKETPAPGLAGSVEVRLTYADLTPMEDELVHLAHGADVLGSMWTDLEGVAQFAGVPAGTSTVWLDGTAVEAQVDVTQGAHHVAMLRTDVESPMVAPGALDVLVLGTDADALVGAAVRVTRKDLEVGAVLTDDVGRAWFSLPQGYYVVSGAGTDAVQITVLAGAITHHVLQLVAVGRVAVELRDSNAHRPSARVIILEPRGGPPFGREQTDADGHCMFDLVPEGEYDLYLEDQATITQPVVVTRDATTSVNLLAPVPDAPNHSDVVGAIDVLVVDPQGTLSQGATVYLLDDVGEQVADTTSDPDGRAQFDELEPGVYGLSGPFTLRDEVGIAVDPGMRRSVILEVESRHAPNNGVGTLVVAAWFEGTNLACVGLWVKLAQGGTVKEQRLLDANGNATFEGVEIGDYRIFVEGREAEAVECAAVQNVGLPVMIVLAAP